ncbi:MAG: transcription antitermination factor NusB [Nitriliruptorales bacterium]|nr:transcription antitermination factor NusB [Nitriliruptorales bacterium]
MGQGRPTTDAGAPGANTRHAARQRALEILYEADLKDRPLADVLAGHMAADDPPAEFAIALVRGVHRHRDEVDGLIETHSRGWKLSRMPIVDRNVLRLSLFELLHTPDVPTAVAIDEAVELVKELSTADSGRFVNGLLARVVETLPGT